MTTTGPLLSRMILSHLIWVWRTWRVNDPDRESDDSAEEVAKKDGRSIRDL